MGSYDYSSLIYIAMSPEEHLRHLCAAIAVERDFDKLRSLLRELDFTLAEFGLDLQNRAVFFNDPSSISNPHKKAS